MERDRNTEILNAYTRITSPWTVKGLTPPVVSVIEIARSAGLSNPACVVSELRSGVVFGENGRLNKRLILVNEEGQNVENLSEEAKKASPYKRAVNQADYRSRAPGGGPVVKRRVKRGSLDRKQVQLGKGRLKVDVEDYCEDEEKLQERMATKKRLSQTWQGKTVVEDVNLVDREKKEKATSRTNSFMSFLESESVMSPQRPARIKELLMQASTNTGEAIFINWVCPPGTPLEYDEETGKLYRLFSGTDPKQGFEKDYRLYPRIDLERRFVGQIDKLGTQKAAYIKNVADDNPYCLYPACIRIEGEEETLSSIGEYSEYVQGQLDSLVGDDKIWVMRWSELLGPELFQESVARFKNTKYADLEPYLPPSVLDTEIDVLSKHTSPNPELLPVFRQFAKDVIVQYNVEMDMLYDAFGDNVVLAWNESTRRGAMIDALRKSKGRPPIPIIYVLHRRRNEEIVNNF